MVETIVIIMGETKITTKITNILQNKENKIISLDYESHQQLNAMGLKHEIYDDYLNDIDKETIDKVTLQLTTTWYKNKQIQDNLTLNGINFGWLLEQEFHNNLLTINTTVLTLLKIKENDQPKTIIFSNDLSELVKNIFQNEKLQPLENVTDIQRFGTDKLSIKYNIGKIPIVYRIPRKYFFVLRRYYEKIFVPLFNVFFSNFVAKKNSILLVDFNLTQYGEFLKQLNKRNVNILLLNRRRVAIWNFKSFIICRKTKAIPVTYEQFLDLDDKREIDELTSNIIKKLDMLLSNKKLFSEIFSVNNFSFWDYLNKYFRTFCVDRFKEAVYEMVGAKKLLSSLNPKLVLHFYEVALQEKVLIHEARKNNIPSILIQHGTPFLSLPRFPSLNPIAGTLPLFDDKKLAVWGNFMKKYALENGIKEDNIIVSGSLRHDDFFHMEKQHDTKGIILIALGALDKGNVDQQSLTSHNRYEQCLVVMCNVLKKIHDRKKIVKLHPGDMVFKTVVVEPIIRKMDPSIQIVVDVNIGKLLQSADVVITIDLTTALLEANIFEKPTMTLVADHQAFLSILCNGYTELFTDAEEERFEKYLNDILTNRKVREENIKKGIEFVNRYLVNQGNASEYLAKVITNNLS